jgi:hypothetical protein
VTQKGEAEFGVGTDAVQAVFGDRLNLSDGVTAKVGEFDGLKLGRPSPRPLGHSTRGSNVVGSVYPEKPRAPPVVVVPEWACGQARRACPRSA